MSSPARHLLAPARGRGKLDASSPLGYLAGMTLWKVLTRTLRTWWQALTPLVLLNTAWMVLQLPLVTAPVATAVFAALVYDLVSEGEVNYATIRPLAGRLWWAALRWGALNLLVWGILLGNFLLSRDAPQAGWWFLRAVWAVMALLWAALNLYFWPLYLRSAQPSVAGGVRAAARFLLLHPGLGFGAAALAAALLVFSAVLTFFLVVVWMSWAALLAEYAVRAALERSPA